VKALLTAAANGGRALGWGLADLILPGVCVACGAAEASAELLCDHCNVRLLSLVALPYCVRCGATIGPNIPIHDEGCWACPTPLPRFVRAVRLGPYTGPLRMAVRDLKYRHHDAMRRRLGDLLASAVAAQCSQETFDMAVPVPAHWLRRLSRGCDHASRLARAVAGPLGAPVGHELLRIRSTPQQTRMSRSRRIANVRGAFAARDPKTLAGASVLLIDDVTTTGATANETAKVLLAAGALRVTLAVVAKAEPPTAYAEHLGR